jgi:hypothetical protein
VADQNKAARVREKIQEMLEKLGEALDEWFRQPRLKPQSVPIPVDRPHRKR